MRVLDDMRHGWRMAVRRPLVSCCVIAAVALGIGATTAIVSVIEGVLLRPLPFAEPERIVWLHGTHARLSDELFSRANPFDITDWQTRSRSFSALAAFSTYETTVQLPDGPMRVAAASVSRGLDVVLGVRPALGRLLAAPDYERGARSIVLTHETWRALFASDPDVVGRSVEVSGNLHTIVGVLRPMQFGFPHADGGIWFPLALPTGDGGRERSGVWLRTVARLQPGVTVGEAEAEMKAIVAALRQQYPASNADRGIEVEPLRDGLVGAARPVVLLMAGALALVLLIACANIGNLLLALAHDRRREFAVRASLGAGVHRLAGLVLGESLVLTMIGAVIGVALAPLGIRALLALYPGGLPRAAEIGINMRVLAVSGLATVIAALAAGLPSLRHTRRLDLQQTIRAGERGLGTRGERRFRAALVVGQVAVSVALLFGGGLLLRTLTMLNRTQLGFRTENILTFSLSLAGSRYPDATAVAAFHDGLQTSLRALPGVHAAGASSLLPLAPGEFLDGFRREGMADEMPNLPIARLHITTPGYTETLGLRLLEGRGFTAADGPNAPRVVLINEALARRYYPQGALGRRMMSRREWREIVGVVADKHHRDMRAAADPELYVPDAQADDPLYFSWYAVRADSDPAALVPALRRILAALDPTIALDDVATMQTRVADKLAPDRFRAYLVAALAALALLLALLGIYGLVAYAVTRQTREIGIRKALGETPGGTVTRVLAGALHLSLLGSALGLVLALAGSRLIAQFVPEVGTRDPVTLAVVPLLFLATALLAALGPATRASAIDPALTMRSD